MQMSCRAICDFADILLNSYDFYRSNAVGLLYKCHCLYYIRRYKETLQCKTTVYKKSPVNLQFRLMLQFCSIAEIIVI